MNLGKQYKYTAYEVLELFKGENFEGRGWQMGRERKCGAHRQDRIVSHWAQPKFRKSLGAQTHWRSKGILCKMFLNEDILPLKHVINEILRNKKHVINEIMLMNFPKHVEFA